MRRHVPIPILAALVTTSLTGAARAERGELTEHSPYTLNPGEVRLGLFDAAVGLFGHDLLRRIEIGTRPLAWIPIVAGVPSYGVHGKFELWRDRHLSIAIAAEHLAARLPIEQVKGEPARASFQITALEGWAGLRLGRRVRLNTGVVATDVALRGRMEDAGSIDKVMGGVGVSNTQLRANLQLAVTRTIHVVLGGRYLPWQEEWAEVSATERVGPTEHEGEVTGSVRAEMDYENTGGRAWSVGGELHFAWKHTNLRLGVEYGNYNVPIINFVAPMRGWLPVLDLYWRI